MGWVVSWGHSAIECARQEKTWRTLSALLEMGGQYYAEKEAFPVSVEEIKSVDPRVPLVNPWGNAYAVVSRAPMWCLKTRVPKGSAHVPSGAVFASIYSEKDGDDLYVCRPVM